MKKLKTPKYLCWQSGHFVRPITGYQANTVTLKNAKTTTTSAVKKGLPTKPSVVPASVNNNGENSPPTNTYRLVSFVT